MKSKIIAVALAIATFGSTAWAQDNNVTNAQETQTTCCQQQMHKKGQKHGMKCKQMRKHNGKHFNAFEGIELTAEQRQAIDNLKTQNREAKKQAKENRRQAAMQARAERQDQLRAILTPEQFAQYEQNVAAARSASKDAKCDSAKKMKMKKGECKKMSKCARQKAQVAAEYQK